MDQNRLAGMQPVKLSWLVHAARAMPKATLHLRGKMKSLP